MGWAIDPNDPVAVEQAMAEALARPRARPQEIEQFATTAFEARMNAAIDRLFAKLPSAPRSAARAHATELRSSDESPAIRG